MSRGTSSLCEHLLAGANLRLSREVTNVERSPSVGTEAPRWRVTAADGTTSSFDGVVLTPPAPQAARLVSMALGDDGGRALTESLGSVTYSSRWALAISLPAEAWESALALGWDARYVSKEESESVCYIAIDQLKRGQAPVAADKALPAHGPVVVVHANVPWSIQEGAAAALTDEPAGLRLKIQVF